MHIKLLGVIALLALAGCGGQADGGEPKTETVTVSFHLADYDTAYYGCQGTGGYSDISPGTSVTVKNGDGKVLGATTLGVGTASSNGAQQAYCDWTVKVPDVAADEGFYAVEVGSRGAVTMSKDDLAGKKWTVSVSLGSL